MSDDPFERVLTLPDLKRTTFKTPGSGSSSRPFQVLGASEDGLEVRTSQGGRVTLRAEAFAAAAKAIADLGEVEPEGWVRSSDEALTAVVSSENRDRACVSYVLPLLEAAGLVELDRSRPARVRARRPGA